MKLVGPINSGAAAGAAGSATANATTNHPIAGYLFGVYVKYNDSPPGATTDVTIATQGTLPYPPTKALLTLTNAATDGWFYPRVPTHDLAGVADSGSDWLIVYDYVKVTIAGADANDNVDVWLLVDGY